MMPRITDAWINGSPAVCPATTPVINPANGQPAADVGLCCVDQITEAISAAEVAGQQWRHTTAAHRSNILHCVHDRLIAEQNSIAQLITEEQGKPLVQSIGEVLYAASFFQWFAEQVRRQESRVVAHPEPNREYLLQSTPLGVAGLITPWNFPLALGAKKTATALAAGCAAVWKPSELTPLSALAMGPLLKDCGVPDGLIQIVPAVGPVAGQAFAQHPKMRIISLTGSIRTGQTVMRAAADQLQKISLELGGNAPFIILPDADIPQTVDDLLQLKLLVSGQVCVSANRVFVPEDLLSTVVDCLRDRLKNVRVGPGTEPGVRAGPLIHQHACETIQSKIQAACDNGASIVAENLSAPRRSDENSGSWFPPTILTNVTDSMKVASDELFGPVISLLSYTDVDEAVYRANATEYGLAGYVYGQDVKQMRSVAERLDVGIVGVNEWRPLRAEIPFGGVKQSGIGAEGGTNGLDEFTHWKVLSLPR
jgi:succinate-semialdehyde dehydrogenase / glutarate-semialdehyde dehydrogenase